MPEPQFRQAAQRHFRDALYLRGDGHLANADHLSGFAAECAIKGLVVEHLGGRIVGEFPYTSTNLKLQMHIASLWSTVASLAVGRSEPEVVALFQGQNPFRDWNVSDRYSEGSHLTATTVSNHLAGAERAIVALEAAALSMNDGSV